MKKRIKATNMWACTHDGYKTISRERINAPGDQIVEVAAIFPSRDEATRRYQGVFRCTILDASDYRELRAELKAAREGRLSDVSKPSPRKRATR